MGAVTEERIYEWDGPRDWNNLDEVRQTQETLLVFGKSIMFQASSVGVDVRVWEGCEEEEMARHAHRIKA